MFERFTESARRTLFFARYEVSKLGGRAIEAEHLLLGMLRAPEGVATRLLSAAGISYSEVRAAIQGHTAGAAGVPVSEEIPFSAEAKRVLERAGKEADGFAHKDIDNEHLLVAMVREDGSFAAGLLGRAGLNMSNVVDSISNASQSRQEPAPAGRGVVSQPPSTPLGALEAIRIPAEDLARSAIDPAAARLRLDGIYRHLDTLKRSFPSE
jgi:ATP-dependent Clp protease ATP-binding subunit ClpC